MLEEVGAVEVGQSVAVGREVRRNPIEKDADATLMEVINQEHEILGRPVARSRREVAGGLISPGPIEGVLHDREKLDVGEAHVEYVVSELGSELAVGQGALMLFGDAHPGADVNFIDGDGALEGVAFGAPLEPVRIGPLVVELPDDRGGARWTLLEDPEGIGFVGAVTVVMGIDVELVEGALGDAGEEALPDAGASACMEFVDTGDPMIERTDDRDFAGIGGPDAEAGAQFAV